MTDIDKQLDQCFLSSFPILTPQDVRRASVETVPGWDSTAHVVLLASVAEVFGIDFEMDEYEVLISYDEILGSVKRKVGGA